MTKTYVTILCEILYVYGICTCLAATKLNKSPLGDIMPFKSNGTLCT